MTATGLQTIMCVFCCLMLQQDELKLTFHQIYPNICPDFRDNFFFPAAFPLTSGLHNYCSGRHQQMKRIEVELVEQRGN